MSTESKRDDAATARIRTGHLKNDKDYDCNDDEDDDDDREVSAKVKHICTEFGLSPFFESRDEAEYNIRLTQCHLHRGFRVNRNDRREYCIKCAHDACPFFLTTRSSKKKGEFLHDGCVEHTCDINDHVIHEYPSPAAHSGFLAKYLRTHICNGIKSNKQLIQKVIEELGCTVSTSTMNRALNIATETYLNNHKDGYDLLFAYATHIRQCGGYVHLEMVPTSTGTCTGSTESNSATTTPTTAETATITSDVPTEPLRFARIFVSIREQIQCYAPYLEYVCFDAFTLHGMYGGILLTASSKDPNDEIVIVAQAIVPEETIDQWNYFFHHFQTSGLGRNIKFIMSDRDNRVVRGVEDIIFNIPRTRCIRNIKECFEKKFGADAVPLLQDLATAYTWQEYNTLRDSIKVGKLGDKMMEWIDRTDPDMWCRALFSQPRLDVTTSNSVEIDSSILKDTKHVPILELLLKIENDVLVQRQQAQRNALTPKSNVVTDVAVQKIRLESNEAVYCQCRSTSKTTATVSTTKNNIVHEFNVDIANMSCTCRKYQERLIPCCHAIKFITSILKVRPELHCGPIHSVDRLRMMYTNETDHTSTATTTEQLLEIGRVQVEPPIINDDNNNAGTVQVKKRGRPPSSDSITNGSSNNKSKHRLCPVCEQPGHYRQTCPALNAERGIYDI